MLLISVVFSNEEDFATAITSLLNDYFTSGEPSEFIEGLKELNAPHFYPKAVETAISVSLEKKDKERELTSKLFSALLLHEKIVSEEQFTKGYVAHNECR